MKTSQIHISIKSIIQKSAYVKNASHKSEKYEKALSGIDIPVRFMLYSLRFQGFLPSRKEKFRMKRMIDTMYPSMPWDEIDAVVFDIGNVLVEMDEHQVLRAMFPDDEALRRRVLLHTLRSPYWHMLDGGELSMDECVEAMTEGDPTLLSPVRRFVTGWPDYRYIVEEGRNAVYTCKEHGKKLYLLSNYPVEHYERNLREYDFFSLFDGAVISARVHMLKPRFDIYRYLTDTYSLAPERTLFIDDSSANIEAALMLGWRGFCLNEPGKLQKFLGAE